MSFSKNIQIAKPLSPLSNLMEGRRLTIQAYLDQVQILRSLVNQAAEEAGFQEDEQYATQLAVSEACENIILHGYGRENQDPIEMYVQPEPGSIQIDLWDNAEAFNPAQSPKQPEWSPDDPPVGGLGLIIIHRVMDEVHYAREAGRNHLSMKKLAASQEQG
jgi:serine/threonine-protein kinase RsbW